MKKRLQIFLSVSVHVQVLCNIIRNGNQLCVIIIFFVILGLENGTENTENVLGVGVFLVKIFDNLIEMIE